MLVVSSYEINDVFLHVFTKFLQPFRRLSRPSSRLSLRRLMIVARSLRTRIQRPSLSHKRSRTEIIYITCTFSVDVYPIVCGPAIFITTIIKSFVSSGPYRPVTTIIHEAVNGYIDTPTDDKCENYYRGVDVTALWSVFAWRTIWLFGVRNYKDSRKTSEHRVCSSFKVVLDYIERAKKKIIIIRINRGQRKYVR